MGYGQAREVVIAGGGLAGLTAAAFLARGGASVQLLEKRSEPGGRARTLEREEFNFDLGAHAIYREGPAAAVYRELGIELEGGTPPPSQIWTLDRGEIFPFPASPQRLLRASGLSWSSRVDFGRYFLDLVRAEPAEHAGRAIGDWIRERTDDPATRRLARALVRLTTYHGGLDQDAAAVLEQLQLAAGEGVVYPDGGWGTIVQRLHERAEAAGARIACSARVDEIHRTGGRWRVLPAEAAPLDADAVVLAAGSPGTAVRLLREPPFSLWSAARDARPVTVGCLDLGLRRLPDPSRPFVLGADRPLYVSDYASVADVAPEAAALVHAVRYVDGEDPGVAEAELEAFLDRVQPGWQENVVVRQFLPRMTVHHDRPAPERGGLEGRYGPAVPDADGLYVAGDWVGATGMLSDAAVASGRRAAMRILAAERGEQRTLPVQERG